MTNRDILTHQFAIKKLHDTSLLPWEDVLETSDFFSDIDKASQVYNKANTNLQLEFARYGLENLERRDEQKEDEERDEKIDAELTLLSSEGLTVKQLENKEEETEKLFDTEVKNVSLPSLDIKVIKKLYEDSKSRREKEFSATEKKKEKKGTEIEEPYFTVDDVRAYIALGITKKPERKSQG